MENPIYSFRAKHWYIIQLIGFGSTLKEQSSKKQCQLRRDSHFYCCFSNQTYIHINDTISSPPLYLNTNVGLHYNFFAVFFIIVTISLKKKSLKLFFSGGVISTTTLTLNEPDKIANIRCWTVWFLKYFIYTYITFVCVFIPTCIRYFWKCINDSVYQSQYIYFLNQRNPLRCQCHHHFFCYFVCNLSLHWSWLPSVKATSRIGTTSCSFVCNFLPKLIVTSCLFQRHLL